MNFVYYTTPIIMVINLMTIPLSNTDALMGWTAALLLSISNLCGYLGGKNEK